VITYGRWRSIALYSVGNGSNSSERQWKSRIDLAWVKAELVHLSQVPGNTM